MMSLGIAAYLQNYPPPELWFRDALGVVYRFRNYPFWLPPDLHNVVYAYVNSQSRAGYFGKASDLRNRQSGHEKRLDAWFAGYDRLYVHAPSWWDPIDFETAEERLITYASPPMNEKFNRLAGLFAR